MCTVVLSQQEMHQNLFITTSVTSNGGFNIWNQKILLPSLSLIYTYNRILQTSNQMPRPDDTKSEKDTRGKRKIITVDLKIKIPF